MRLLLNLLVLGLLAVDSAVASRCRPSRSPSARSSSAVSSASSASSASSVSPSVAPSSPAVSSVSPSSPSSVPSSSPSSASSDSSVSSLSSSSAAPSSPSISPSSLSVSPSSPSVSPSSLSISPSSSSSSPSSSSSAVSSESSISSISSSSSISSVSSVSSASSSSPSPEQTLPPKPGCGKGYNWIKNGWFGGPPGVPPLDPWTAVNSPPSSEYPEALGNCGTSLDGLTTYATCVNLAYFGYQSATSLVSQDFSTPTDIGAPYYNFQFSFNVRLRTSSILMYCKIEGQDDNGNTVSLASVGRSNPSLGNSYEWQTIATTFEPISDTSRVTCWLQGSIFEQDYGSIWISDVRATC